MSRRNNQHFVQLPHARFSDMLTYKAQLVSIHVIVQEESYTSKASFLDLDSIPVYSEEGADKAKFSERRVKRGIYQLESEQTLNADINESDNIMLKALPNAVKAHGIEDANEMKDTLVVHPERIVVPLRTRKSRVARVSELL